MSKRYFESLEDASDTPFSASEFFDQDDFDTNLPHFNDSWDSFWDSALDIGVFDEISTTRHGDAPSDPSDMFETDDLQESLDDFTSQIEDLDLDNVGHCINAWAETTLPCSPLTDHHGTVTVEHQEADPVKMCFGMLAQVPVRLVGDMQDLHAVLQRNLDLRKLMSLHATSDLHFVELWVSQETTFGQVHDALTQPLKAITALCSVELEAFADIEHCIKRINKAKRQNDSVIKVDINVYGEESARSEVGRILSAAKVWLQHTQHRSEDFVYDNPHMVTFGDLELPAASDASDPTEPPVASLEQKDVAELIKAIGQEETADRGLAGLKSDVSVRTPLTEHQEQALEFMVQREVGPVDIKFQLWHEVDEPKKPGYRHSVSHSWKSARPLETGCGILADDMGMGKTLSALSLVTSRMEDGHQWSQSRPESSEQTGSSLNRTRATLVVVPSLVIMNVWLREVAAHLDGSMSILRYHGKRRAATVDKFPESDLVLTTYHTIAAEKKRRSSPLQSFLWFRIVLDEAHTIRRSSNTLFAAVADIHACNRWCLTGTPIQNTLDDLGALLAFMRLEPFTHRSVFRKSVIAPFFDQTDGSDIELASQNLRAVLNAVCLRRTKKRLHLLPLDEKSYEVILSTEEREHYETTLENMAHAMTHGNRQKLANTPFGKFQIQLQLRILCNHGTFQKSFSWNQDDPQTQREDVVSSMGNDTVVVCSGCHNKVLALETTFMQAHKQTQSLSGDSGVLCGECLEQDDSQRPAEDSHETRPVITDPGALKAWRLRRRQTFDETGQSAKLAMLVTHVQEHLLETKR